MNMVIRMPRRFVANPVEVDHRLAELGWKREELLEVVDAMVSARFSCTDNDPVSAPGWMSWKDGTRRLREIGRKSGLEISNEDQIPWLVDIKRGRRFSVANTDDATGHQFRLPQNNSRKGAATDRVVAENQSMLFEESELPQAMEPLTVAREGGSSMQSWYLCVYTDGIMLSAEISCPVAIEGGYFIDFHERIVLIEPGSDSAMLSPYTDEEVADEPFDIPVSKK